MSSSSSSNPYPLTNDCSAPAYRDVATGVGWAGWPLVTGSDINAFCLLIQLWQAMRERGYTGGGLRFPRLNDTNISEGCSPSSSSAGTCNGDIGAGGIVTHVTYDAGEDQYVIADSAAWWVGGPTCTYFRLVNYTCDPGDDTIPSSYDCMFEVKGSEDWTGVIRGSVLAQDNEYSFRIDAKDIDDVVTAGYLSAPDDLIGCKFYFIKAGGLWWADVANPLLGRWPPFPNDWELEKGTGTGHLGGTFTDSQTGPKKEWKLNEFADKELLVNGSDGKLHRLPIYCNDHTTLYLSPCSSSSSSSVSSSSSSSSSGMVLSGRYIIVSAGGKGMPNRDPWQPYAWYTGANSDQRNANPQSHDPTDAFSTFDKPVSNVVWEEMDCETIPFTCFCRDYNHPGSVPGFPNGAVDYEMWTELDNECDPDKSYSPHLYWSIRSLQNLIISSAPSFIEKKSYAGLTGRNLPPPLTAARMFQLDNTNAYQTTIADVADLCTSSSSSSVFYPGTAKLAAAFTPTPEVLPEVVYFAIYDSLGQIKLHGPGTYSDPNVANLYSGSSSSSGGGAVATLSADNITTEHCGMTVIISFAYDRYIPREFLYLWDKCCFIPDTCTRGFSTTIKYPPAPCNYCCEEFDELTGESLGFPPEEECCKDCSGVGTWYLRPASTTYCEADGVGNVLPGGIPFQVGELARHSGDAFHHGFDGRENFTGSNSDLKRPWFDHFFRGKHPEGTSNRITQQRNGIATAGGHGFITDANQNWWDAKWYEPLGSNHIDTGTATGGSTNTLIDTTKNPEALGYPTGPGCYWQDSRFIGFGSNPVYKSFILEVEIVPDSNVWEKRPILSGNSATQTLTVIGDFSATTSGKRYRITEPPGELNRWKGRRLRLYPATCPMPSSSSSSATSEHLSSSSSGGGVPYHEVIITHSDDTGLWWDTTVTGQDITAQSCWVYEIIDYPEGNVWQFSTTKPLASARTPSGAQLAYVQVGTNAYWVQPNGNDTARLGVITPAAFHERQEENLPTIVKRFGPMRVGDYISMETLNQMYKAINRMRWTLRNDPQWRSRADLDDNGSGGTEELNNVAWEGTGAEAYLCDPPEDCCAYWPRLQAFVDDQLAAIPDPPVSGTSTLTESGGAPFKYAGVGTGDTVTFSFKGGQYAYAYLFNVPTVISCDADLYTYSALSYADEDETVYEESCPGDPEIFCSLEGQPDPIHSTDPLHGNYWDDFGDPILYRQWQLWNTASFGGPLRTRTRRSDIIGSFDTLQGEWPDPMPCFQDGCSPATCDTEEICNSDCNADQTCFVCSTGNQKGYAIIDQFVILKWDVPGGLTFVD